MMRYYFALLLWLSFGITCLYAQSRHPFYHTIYRATTADGIVFSEEITPIAQHASAIATLRMANGTVHLYAMTYASPNAQGVLSVATSVDGRTFSPFRAINIPGTPANVIGDPFPVFHTDGRIRLYYIDAELGTVYEMYSAISTDGINFTHENGLRLLRNGVMSNPDLIRIGNSWNLYVTVPGNDNRPRIMRASSNDGLSFTWDQNFTGYDGGETHTVRLNQTVRTYFVNDNNIKSATTADGRTLDVESGTRLPNALSPSMLNVGGNNVMYFVRSERENTPPIGDREEWKYNRLVIGRQPNVDPNVLNPAMADVIRINDGTYRMYYNAGRPGSSEIRVAISADGLTWVYAAVCLRGSGLPTERTHTISGPRVIVLPDGRFRMYYNAWQQAQPNQRPASHVRSAISTDGINFTPETGIRMEVFPNDVRGNFAFLGRMSVFALPNGNYGAFVNANPTGDNTAPDLFFATSPDGLVWSNYRRVYTDYQSPKVIRKGNTFILYSNYLSDYTSRVESNDGLNWTNQPVPVTVRDGNNSPLALVEEPTVVLNRDNQLMMYGNYRSTPNTGIDHIAYYEMISQSGNNGGNNNPNCTLEVSATTTFASSTITSNGVITVNAMRGTMPYAYSLSGRPAQNSNVFNNLEAGQYSIQVRDAVGCVATVNVELSAFNTGGNNNTERWNAKKYAIGFKAGNEQRGQGSLIMPNVIRLTNNTYRMFYNAGKPGESVIKWSFSTDGLTWSQSGIALRGNSQPTDREYIIGGASVVQLQDGRFRMYYRATGQFGDGQMPQYHIRSAISTDGYNFTREQGVRIDITPFAPNSMFKLVGHSNFYFLPESQTYAAVLSVNTNNDNGPSDLYIGYSPDGLTWSNFRLLYADVHDPVVIRKDGQFILYAMYLKNYTGKAVSTDGVNWPRNMERIYAYDLDGKDKPLIGDNGGVVTRDNKLLLYGNYFSGLEPFEDHIVVYEMQNLEQICTRQPINLNLTATPSACTSCSTGVIRATATNGQEPYLYSINDKPAFSSGNFGNLAPGEYTISVRDGRGCTASGKIKVEAVNQPTNPKCLRPADLYVENVTHYSADLIWVAVNGATGYAVGHRLRLPNTNFTYVNVPASQTRYSLGGLAFNTSYEVVVRTICENNTTSEGTPIRSFTTTQGTMNTCAPTLNVFLSPTATTMTVTWNIMPSALNYEVILREDGQLTGQTLLVQAPRNYVRITGLKVNTRYVAEVRVQCYDKSFSVSRSATANTLAFREELSDFDEAVNFSLYPNPASEFVTFSYQTEEEFTLSVYNITGNQIHSVNLGRSGQATIDVSQYPSGIYVLKAQGTNGLLFSKKLVVVH